MNMNEISKNLTPMALTALQRQKPLALDPNSGLKLETITKIFNRVENSCCDRGALKERDCFDSANTMAYTVGRTAGIFTLLSGIGGFIAYGATGSSLSLIPAASSLGSALIFSCIGHYRVWKRDKELLPHLEQLSKKCNYYGKTVVSPEDIPTLFKWSNAEVKIKFIAEMNFAQLSAVLPLTGPSDMLKYLKKNQADANIEAGRGNPASEKMIEFLERSQLPGGVAKTVENNDLLVDGRFEEYLINSKTIPLSSRLPFSNNVEVTIEFADKQKKNFEMERLEAINSTVFTKIIEKSKLESSDATISLDTSKKIFEKFLLASEERLPHGASVEELYALMELCIALEAKDCLDYLEIYIISYQPFSVEQLEEYLYKYHVSSGEVRLPRLREFFEGRLMPCLTSSNVCSVYSRAVKGNWKKKKAECEAFVKNNFCSALVRSQGRNTEMGNWEWVDGVPAAYRLCSEILEKEQMEIILQQLNKSVTEGWHLRRLWEFAKKENLISLEEVCKEFCKANHQKVINNLPWTISELPKELLPLLCPT